MTVLLILSVSGMAFAFADLYTDVFEKPLKPFSCAPCMSFWIGASTALLTHDIFLIFVPYLVTKIVSKFLWS